MSDQKVDAPGDPGKDTAAGTPAEKTFENEGGAVPAAEPATRPPAAPSLMERAERAMGMVKQRFAGTRK